MDRTHYPQLSLEDRDHIQVMRKQGKSLRSIDIVVNNAGIARNTPAEEISDSEWLEVMVVLPPKVVHLIEWYIYLQSKS